jgi:hypothetical protein
MGCRGHGEANALVPVVTDPESKTPAFKAVRVTVDAAGAGRVPLALVPGAHGLGAAASARTATQPDASPTSPPSRA